jgi:NADH-quinone oxidoreductase subunit A
MGAASTTIPVYSGRAMLAPLATAALFAVVGAATLVGARAVASRLPVERDEPPPEPDEIPVVVVDDDPNGGPPIDPRFFPAAVLFLLFDAAVALLFPVALVFRRWVLAGHARHALGALFLFIAVLAAGLTYAWKKGDLDRLRPPG